MNKEDYVSLEVAKLLKEKGYEDFGESHYIVIEDCEVEVRGLKTKRFEKGQTLNMDSETTRDFLCPDDKCLQLPDINDINDWLIKKHGLYVCVNVNASGWFWEITRVATGSTVKTSEYSGPNDGGCWDAKYDALCNGIIYCLKLI